MCNGPLMSLMNKHLIEKQDEIFFYKIYNFFSFILENK